MYNIYKFNKNDDSINSRFQQNLNLLRLDFTENASKNKNTILNKQYKSYKHIFTKI